MVDTQDLKSCDHYGCAGSSPAPGTEKRASVRARAITLASFFPLTLNEDHTLFGVQAESRQAGRSADWNEVKRQHPVSDTETE
jgi:hypothetical protein